MIRPSVVEAPVVVEEKFQVVERVDYGGERASVSANILIKEGETVLKLLEDSHKNWKYIMLASAVSSILFYLITNFGVWFSGTMYPKTWAGLMDSFFMGLPFFRNTLVGDFGYSFIFFGGYALVRAQIGKLNWEQKDFGLDKE